MTHIGRRQTSTELICNTRQRRTEEERTRKAEYRSRLEWQGARLKVVIAPKLKRLAKEIKYGSIAISGKSRKRM